MKSNPFVILDSITNKKYLDDLTDYNPHLINKSLAQFPDTILYANEMNMNYHIPNQWQYDYFYYAIKRGKRRTKWFKAEKNDDLKAVMNYYKINQTKAKEAMRILSPEQLSDIKRKTEVGLNQCRRC